MNNSYQTNIFTGTVVQTVEEKLVAFFRVTYAWMTAGLFMTALTAFFVVMSPSILTFVSRFYLIILALELIIVFSFPYAMRKASYATLIVMFLFYSFLTGVTFSFLLLLYTDTSVFGAFLVTSGMFGALSLYGMVTKRDLTGMGKFLYMSLIGLILSMVINLFIGGTVLSLVISIAGVFIFAGLTIYDTYKLKRIVIETDSDIYQSSGKKLAIYGALVLYLDFINMFLMILRLFGRRR